MVRQKLVPFIFVVSDSIPQNRTAPSDGIVGNQGTISQKKDHLVIESSNNETSTIQSTQELTSVLEKMDIGCTTLIPKSDSSWKELSQILDNVKAAGIHNVFLVGGALEKEPPTPKEFVQDGSTPIQLHSNENISIFTIDFRSIGGSKQILRRFTDRKVCL